jgi:hypothetical protein
MTNDWIKKYGMPTTENYSAIKKNEITSFVGNWMELEIIMLSKISHAQTDRYCMFLLICRI